MTLSGFVNNAINVSVKTTPQIYMLYNATFYCEDTSVTLDASAYPVVKHFNEVNWNTPQTLVAKSSTPGTKTIKWENTAQYFVSGGEPFPGKMFPLKGSFDINVTPVPPAKFTGAIPGGYTYYSSTAFKVPGDLRLAFTCVLLNERVRVEKTVSVSGNFNTGGPQAGFLLKVTKPDSSVEYVGSSGGAFFTAATYTCDQLGTYTFDILSPFIYVAVGFLAALPTCTWVAKTISPDGSVTTVTDTISGIKEPGRITKDVTEGTPAGTAFTRTFPDVAEDNIPSALVLALTGWNSNQGFLFPTTFSGTVTASGMNMTASGHWLIDTPSAGGQAAIHPTYTLSYSGIDYGITFSGVSISTIYSA